MAASLRVTAIAHPNVALVKYWGKRPGGANIPAAPSLSIALDGLTTRTEVVFDERFATDSVVVNGRATEDARIIQCLERMRTRAGTPALRARIESTNDFPTAAGLASSASGFAALVTATDAALDLKLTERERSIEARLASASAARSVVGGFAALQGSGLDSDSWCATPVDAASEDWLHVVIAVCDTAQKAVPSSEGMRRSALTSPYYNRWLGETNLDFDLARAAVSARDFDALARVTEASCLKMHAVMLTSVPSLVYWNAATLECIHAVRRLRDRGTPVCFTIDAGPQVKAVCLPDAATQVASTLAGVPGVYETRTGRVGGGARIVE